MLVRQKYCKMKSNFRVKPKMQLESEIGLKTDLLGWSYGINSHCVRCSVKWVIF